MSSLAQKLGEHVLPYPSSPENLPLNICNKKDEDALKKALTFILYHIEPSTFECIADKIIELWLIAPLDPRLLYKNLNPFKVDDIHNLEIGKITHKIYSVNPPDKFMRLFTSLNQIHSYATRNATQGAFFW